MSKVRDDADHGLTSEQQLVLAVCAVHPPSPDVIADLAAQVSAPVLLTLLERLHLVTLVGSRLRDTGVILNPEFRARVDAASTPAGAQGRLHTLVMLSLNAELAAAGIRSVALKGSTLALAVHGDPALRVAGDLDLLVDPADLPEAVTVAQRLGWQPCAAPSGRLPLLHAELVHPELPPLELHWRVHWYEERFSADALARATAAGPAQPLRMQPVDELAALLLFHVRDGLSGLRLAADVSAWMARERRPAELAVELAGLARRYPALARPLAAGVRQLAGLIGLPLPPPAPVTVRERAACRLANPFLTGSRTQVRADASFVDILLAPPGGGTAAAARQFANRPERGTGAAAATGHVARTLARWAASAAYATIVPRPGAA